MSMCELATKHHTSQLSNCQAVAPRLESPPAAPSILQPTILTVLPPSVAPGQLTRIVIIA
jgi:hypothetical protein